MIFDILLGDVLQHHVDVDVEAAEGADELLVPLHDHPDLGPDAAVDQLCSPHRSAHRRQPHTPCKSKLPIQQLGPQKKKA